MADTKISDLSSGSPLVASDLFIVARSGSDYKILGSGLLGGIGHIILWEQQTANTAGGTFTSGSFQTRVLNTEHLDTNGDCSLSSNQITLTAGTYDCHIRCPAFVVNQHKARLRNVTDSTTVLVGSSEYDDGAAGGGHSFIVGRFTIAASKALEVQHRGQNTRATNGFGVASNFAEIEIYTVAEFWRIA